MKKTMGLLIVLVVLFSITTNAFAASGTLGATSTTKIKIYGGSSLAYAYGAKNEPNTMDLDVKGFALNGQSNMRFRGYELLTSVPTTYVSTDPCTYAKTITGIAYRTATYTTSPSSAEMRISIASSDSGDYAYLAGNYLI